MGKFSDKREEFGTAILAGLKSKLGDQWDSFSDRDRMLVEKVGLYAAKIAAAGEIGNDEYVKSQTPLLEAMVADLESIAAMESATFWTAVLDVGSTVLIKLGKKMLGIPG